MPLNGSIKVAQHNPRCVWATKRAKESKKPCVTDILKKNFFFLVKRAGRHFGFFKRAWRHEKGAGRRALQKKPRQNTAIELKLGGFTFYVGCDMPRSFTETCLSSAVPCVLCPS